MADYLSSLSQSEFVPNIVVRFNGEYFAIRAPDSGLTIDADKIGVVSQLTINPTTIDPFRPSTTISNYSFKLLDRNEVITKMFNGETAYFQDAPVDVWLGRSNVLANATDMDFSEYLQLPTTYINKLTRQDASYTFQTVEARDRLSTGAFRQTTKLAVDILDNTTIITVQNAASFPTNGLVLIDSEYISYTGKDGNNLLNCIRGEQGSTPVEHDTGDDVFLAIVLQDNPIDLLLSLLVSSGGGGSYDTLPDGAGIDQSLIDFDQIEDVRDEFFSTYSFKFILSNVDSLKTFIESEICFPLGIRLRANNNAKIGLALIDRNIFEIDSPTLDDTNLVKYPDFTVDNTKIVNRIRIFWDWDDVKKAYLKVSDFTDADSIAEFGETAVTEQKFKGIRSNLAGADVVDTIQLLFLSRFAFPRPQITVTGQMSTSALNLGDKTDLVSSVIPTERGDLNFVSTLEVLQKSLNLQNGDVRYQLSFTSFSGIRQCYIAPSDTIISFANQKTVTIGAGQGANYRAGWNMRLYSNVTRDYVDTQINTIQSISNDTITFVSDWNETLVNGEFKLSFADYDDVSEQQKKFCFISDGNNNFMDGRGPYQITFG